MGQDNWIITIARNNLHLTKAAVETFLKQDIGNVCVLVINNASDDGTLEWLYTSYPDLSNEIRFITYNKPRSVAECWNQGLAWIFGRGLTSVLVANNDVLLKPETYRLLAEDGGPFVTAVGVNTQEQFDATCEPSNKRPHPDFSCFLIRKEAYQAVGPFDEHYLGAFAEDADYHVRLHRKGIPAYCIGVPFFHVGSATVKNADPEERERIGRQADLNRELFFKTYGQRIGTPGYDTLFTPETFGVE